MQLCVHTVIKALSESSPLNTLQLLPVTFHWGQSLQRRNRLMVDEVVVLFGWIKPEGESLKTTFNILLKQSLIKSNKAVKPHEYIKKGDTRTNYSLSPDNIHGESQRLLHTVRLTLVDPRQDKDSLILSNHVSTQQDRLQWHLNDNIMCLPWPAWWLHLACPKSSADTPTGKEKERREREYLS